MGSAPFAVILAPPGINERRVDSSGSLFSQPVVLIAYERVVYDHTSFSTRLWYNTQIGGDQWTAVYKHRNHSGDWRHCFCRDDNHNDKVGLCICGDKYCRNLGVQGFLVGDELSFRRMGKARATALDRMEAKWRERRDHRAALEASRKERKAATEAATSQEAK